MVKASVFFLAFGWTLAMAAPARAFVAPSAEPNPFFGVYVEGEQGQSPASPAFPASEGYAARGTMALAGWGDSLAMTPLSIEEAQGLFRQFTMEAVLSTGYVYDGCYARAHMMDYQMEQAGIISAKIFAYGSFHISLNRAPDPRNVWNYHIAPVVLVKEGDRYTPYVIDLLLWTGAVPLLQWWNYLASFNRDVQATYHVYPRFAYGPGVPFGNSWDPGSLTEAIQILEKYSRRRY